MKIVAALLLVLPAALATCVYDGTERKDKETWKNGGFQFMCIVLGEGTFTVDITGCIWARTGKVLKLGETVTEDSKTAKCFKEGKVIRFEEKYEGKGMSCTENCGGSTGPVTGAGSKPMTKTSVKGSKGETKKAENKCMFNGKSFTNGAEWRDGSFKYSCATGDFGWKSSITACFWDEDIGGNGQELKIGEEGKSSKATARCFTEDEVTYLNVTPIAKAKSSTTTTPKATPAETKATESAKPETDFSIDARPDKASGYKATSNADNSIKTVVDVVAPSTEQGDCSGCIEINVDLRSGEAEEVEVQVAPKPATTGGGYANSAKGSAKGSAKIQPAKPEEQKPVETKESVSQTKESAKSGTSCGSTDGCIEINADLRSNEEQEAESAGKSVNQSPSSSRPMVKSGAAAEMAANANAVIDAVNVAAASYGGSGAPDADNTKSTTRQESVKPVSSGNKKKVEVRCTPADTPRSNGETWKANGFQYKCSVTENRWKVEIIACIWAKQGDKLIPVDSSPVTIDKITASCNKGQDEMVYFEEKPNKY